MTRIAAVLTCHNRIQKTLACISSMYAANLTDADLEVYLCDDGSTDGTGDAVRAAFPRVRVIKGDGNQYWCGGMRIAMREAAKIPYDFMLWLNDDVELSPDFLDVLLFAYNRAVTEHGGREHVIVGAVINPLDGKLTYSGFRRLSSLHPAKLEKIAPDPAQLVACDTMNGNCVLIPTAIVELVGEIDRAYVQQIGDADYGYRCIEVGAKLWLAPRIVGTCSPNLRRLRWNNSDLSFTERLALLNTPHGLPFRPWVHFMWRFGGAPAILLLIAGYIKQFGRSLGRGF